MTSYPELSFSSDSYIVIDSYIRANKPILLFGSPGIGKTALAHQLASHFDMPIEVIIASTCDPTDFGGFPVVRPDGAFDRVPMRQIFKASKEPCILFLDEISTASAQVQAALLRGVYERVFGEVVLHPDTVIIAAANPPEQAPGGSEMAAPLIGRFAVYNFVPTLGEVQTYFEELGDEDSTLRTLALDLAATAQHMPELYQMNPPQAATTEGALWASPRSWERGLRAWANATDEPGVEVSDDLAYLILAGSVGEHAASGFTAIRKLRVHLPSIADITSNPEKASVPSSPEYQVGALGLLANVATTDVWAAWIYAQRLSDEFAAAAPRLLLRRGWRGAAKHKTKAARARVALMGKIGNDLGA